MYYLCVFANKIYLEALCRSPRWVNCRKCHPLQFGGRKWCPRAIPYLTTDITYAHAFKKIIRPINPEDLGSPKHQKSESFWDFIKRNNADKN